MDTCLFGFVLRAGMVDVSAQNLRKNLMTSVVQSEEILVQQSEPLFIGVDGGGSKCKARLENANGQLLAEAVAGPANPATDFAQTTDSILSACQRVLQQAGYATAPNYAKVLASVIQTAEPKTSVDTAACSPPTRWRRKSPVIFVVLTFNASNISIDLYQSDYTKLRSTATSGITHSAATDPRVPASIPAPAAAAVVMGGAIHGHAIPLPARY